MLALLGSTAACAQASTPPGGEPDRTPPEVIGTSPEPLAVVPGWDEPAVFRFDERISEQGIEEAVLVSPAEVEFEVDKGRSELRVEPKGGWPAGRIIQIELRPEVSDLFRNKRRETVRLVFSTGPPIPETALAGTAFDRLTGRPVPNARVEATLPTGPATYVAMTDTAGTFAFASLPAGPYEVTAYLDRNRSRAPDFAEAAGRAPVELGPTDTVLIELQLLPGDTTPSRLMRAEAIDSLHVRAVFDDPLDPALPPAGVEARLLALPDSQPAGEASEVLHAHEHQRRTRPRAAARETTAAADTSAAAADTAAARADIAGVPADTAGPPADTAAVPPAAPLPARELVLVLDRPLLPGASYVLEITGVTNLHGLTGGGGRAPFTTQAPPPPAPEPPPDTARGGRD